MPEEQFVRFMKKLGLSYEVMNPDRDLSLMKPRYCSAYDLSGVDHAYLVYGGWDDRRERSEDYLVLVNASAEVVYIENWYKHSPPIR